MPHTQYRWSPHFADEESGLNTASSLREATWLVSGSAAVQTQASQTQSLCS